MPWGSFGGEWGLRFVFIIPVFLGLDGIFTDARVSPGSGRGGCCYRIEQVGSGRGCGWPSPVAGQHEPPREPVKEIGDLGLSFS